MSRPAEGRVRWRVGTRGSPLALAQSQQTVARLAQLGIAADLVVVRTSGDRLQQVRLAKVGGKGLFIKELEEALAREEIDAAIHSMKDVPAELPEDFAFGAIPARGPVEDVLLVGAEQADPAVRGSQETRTRWHPEEALAALGSGARVGTGSLRRRAQLAALRPDLDLVGMRGNIDTRVAKLRRGEVDAIVLARAGFERLGLEVPYRILDPERFLPAPGQGALAIEVRAGDPGAGGLGPIHDAETASACTAERGFLRELGASCVVPVAARASIADGEIVLDGMVASLDGREILREQGRGSAADADRLGRSLAVALVARGARHILDEVERQMASQEP